jgi:hypothetical protein
MSCNRNGDKIRKAATRVGIAAGAVGFTIGGLLAVSKTLQSYRHKKQAAITKKQEEDRRRAETEQLKYMQAKKEGKFYDNLGDRFTEEKYLVSGRYRVDDGALITDRIELYDVLAAESLSMSTGYTCWRINPLKTYDETVSYKLTNMSTDEEFISTDEPYGRRRLHQEAMSFELDRAEAEVPHDILDRYSNRVIVP